MLKKSKLRLGAVAVAVCTATLFGAISASADPAAGTFKALSGVGSDTTQDLVAGLASAIPAIGSYDAIGSATIQTKAGGATYSRPNGSGSGVDALSASIDGSVFGAVGGVGGSVITGQVDFARSSGGPNASKPGTDLTFIPFATDAVTFAVNAASDFPRDITLGSAAQETLTPKPFTLRNIYKCLVTSYTDADGAQVTIRPLLPQAGSGTRKFWLGKLGLVEGSLPTCVTDINNTVEEHDGTYLTGPGDIAPFSVAQWIAQGNHKALPTTVIERRGSTVLGNIGGNKPYTITIGGGAVLNASFPITRNVYNVVQTSRLTSDSTIAATFVGSGSAVCTNTAIIKAYGFGVNAACGDTTSFKQALSQ